MHSPESSRSEKIPSISASQASETQYDVIVVGAGVLGSALSTSLARSGRQVLCIERDLTPPHARIVGELLQPGGCEALDKLGMIDVLEGIDAVPCKGYLVLHDAIGNAHIPYPENTHDRIVNTKDTKLRDAWNGTERFQGRSFHHGAFVGSLRRKMVGVDGLDVLEATVNDLIECGTMGGKVIGVKCTPKGSALEKSVSDDGAPGKIEVYAPLTIIADGYASKFRKAINPTVPPAITRSYFVGVELENCDLPMPNHGHVVLPSAAPAFSTSPPSDISIGPILLYGLSPTVTRMLIDISSSKTPTKAVLLETVTPRLPSSVQPSFKAAVADNNPQKVKSMPNSFLPPSQQGTKYAKEGVLLAGDAMNMRHPLTGGGMTVALNDAVILTELLGGAGRPAPSSRSSSTTLTAKGKENAEAATPLSMSDDESDSSTDSTLAASSTSLRKRDSGREVCTLEDWWEVRERLEEWHWRRKGVATCINVLAMALYSLFGADDENLDVLRRGCLKYFHLGGECVNGPVSLLSALNPSPPLLLYHFFAVAFYSIYLLFTDPRTPKHSPDVKPVAPSVLEYPALLFRSIIVFYTACHVILPVLWSEVDF